MSEKHNVRLKGSGLDNVMQSKIISAEKYLQ